jgi:hypothetical protein
LNEAIEIKSFDHFKQEYHKYFERLNDWIDYDISSDLFDYEDDINKLSEIYESYGHNYTKAYQFSGVGRLSIKYRKNLNEALIPAIHDD